MLSIHTVAVVVRTVSLYTPVCTRDALNTHRGCGCTGCKFVHSCLYKGCSQYTPWPWLYGLYVCTLLFVQGMLSIHTVAVAVRTVSLYTHVCTRDALNTHRGRGCTNCKFVHSCLYKGCSQYTPWLWLYGL